MYGIQQNGGMMSSFDTILFDMDGLMLDTERIYRLAWQRAALDLGHRLSDDEFASYVGVKTEKCEEMFIESLGRPLSLEITRASIPADEAVAAPHR